MEIFSRGKRNPQEQSLTEAIIRLTDAVNKLAGPPIGETSIEQKLDVIIDMLSPLGSVPSGVGLLQTRLETIHGLIMDLSTDPEKLAEATAAIKAVREKLQTSIDKQTEGDN
jgi:hypothetical protein